MSIFAVFDRNFNPRSRMGSDRPFRADPRYKYHFNPRSRMGSDLKDLLNLRKRSIFQSTLPHGERPS